MLKLFKASIASLAGICLAVTTVVCCCVAEGVIAHLHKSSVCTHCSLKHSSHTQSPATDSNCVYKLTNAETFQGQAASFSAPVIHTYGFILNQHITTPFLPSAVSSYPRGSPPLSSSFIPLYLRTFTLRV